MATQTISSLETLLGGLELNIPIPSFPTADVLVRPLDIGRCYLADLLCNIVEECDRSNAFNSIQWPNNVDNGDLVVILPRLSHGADTESLARSVIQKFKCSLFRLPFADGVHLRIMFAPQTFPRLFLPYINDRKKTYGQDVSHGLQDPSSPDSGRKRVVVEFSSPNLVSERGFEGKHLRSTILGSSIARLHEAMGWEVVRINYLGDWGKPIGLLGAGWERFGSEESFQTDPVGHLLEVYHKAYELFLPEEVASKKARDEGKLDESAEIESQGLFAERNAFFKRMEDGEEKSIALWKRLRDVSIENYTQLYARLNISFDEYSGESRVSPETMAEVEEILKSKKVCEESGGAWTINLKKHAKIAGMGIIRDRAGSTTYLLRDIAAVLERSRKYSFDKMVYVVASDHNTHFTRVVKILELMDMSDLANKLQHVSFSKTSHMPEKMNHAHNTLGDILDRCDSAMEDSLKENAEKATLLGDSKESCSAISSTGLLIQELSAKRASDDPFELAHMTSFNTKTGPDLYYWNAKLGSILKANSSFSELFGEVITSLTNMEESDLLRLLIQYPEISQAAFKVLEPSTITGYLGNIATQLEYCFEDGKQGVSFTPVQVMLYEATRIVLRGGMKLLGTEPPMQL